VKHNPELAQLVVANGGVAALVDSVSEASGNDRLPGIMALGYIAAFSETLAVAVISERGLVQSPPPPLLGLFKPVKERIRVCDGNLFRVYRCGRHLYMGVYCFHECVCGGGVREGGLQVSICTSIVQHCWAQPRATATPGMALPAHVESGIKQWLGEVFLGQTHQSNSARVDDMNLDEAVG
jgi:hypothetical protein